MGFDLETSREVRQSISVPLTVLGGAGSTDHIAQLYHEVNQVVLQLAVFLFSKENIRL